MDARECVLFVARTSELYGLVKAAAVEYCDLITRACSHKVVREGRVPIAAFRNVARRARLLGDGMKRMNDLGTSKFGLPLYYTKDDVAKGLMEEVFLDTKFLPEGVTVAQAQAISREREKLILGLGNEHTTCLEVLAVLEAAESVSVGLDHIRRACTDRVQAERVALNADAAECVSKQQRMQTEGTIGKHPMFDREFLLNLDKRTRGASEKSAAERRASAITELQEAAAIFDNLCKLAKPLLSEDAVSALHDMTVLAVLLVGACVRTAPSA